MPRIKSASGRALFVALAAFYGVFFLGRWGWRSWARRITLSVSKAEYLHD